MVLVEGEALWAGVVLVAIGWALPLGMCAASIPFEIERARLAYAELAAVLQSPTRRHST